MIKPNVCLSNEILEKMYQFRIDYYHKTGIILEDWNEVIKCMLTIVKDNNILEKQSEVKWKTKKKVGEH